jgi:hypothetical protein
MTEGEEKTIAQGLFAIAAALDRVAEALQRLGLNDASTPMGAMELLSKAVVDGFDKVETAANRLAKGIDGTAFHFLPLEVQERIRKLNRPLSEPEGR